MLQWFFFKLHISIDQDIICYIVNHKSKIKTTLKLTPHLSPHTWYDLYRKTPSQYGPSRLHSQTSITKLAGEKNKIWKGVYLFFLILVKRNLREAFMEINEIIVTRQEYSTYKTQTEES